jgi:Sec-independent protein secretion pathway component TatC
MPQEKATKFFERFRQAEGVKKWVYFVMFVLALILAAFDPTWSLYVIIALAGFEAAIAKWEEDITKEEIEKIEEV